MVAELSNAGNHVPVTAVALVELVGKSESVAPKQIASTCVNVGVTGVTVAPETTKLEPVPVNAKLFKVALLPLLVASSAAVILVFVPAATP